MDLPTLLAWAFDRVCNKASKKNWQEHFQKTVVLVSLHGFDFKYSGRSFPEISISF